jgi:hypothetical protein
MKLLTSVLPQGTRILPAGGWFTLVLVGSLIGLEVAGRYTVTDMQDGLAAFALLSIVAVVAMRHRREPLNWITRLSAWLRRCTHSTAWLRYEHGFDLRGTPPLPRRTPRIVWGLVVVLLIWGGIAAVGWALFPTGWRVIGTHTSYVLYLVGLLLLWGTLFACTVVGVFVPVSLTERLVRGSVGDTDRKGVELAAVVGYFILVTWITWVLPPTPVLVLALVVSAGAWIAYFPRGNDGPALLWRAAPNTPVYAVPLRRAGAIVTGLFGLFLFDVLLTACGGLLFGGRAGEEAMPLTALFGAVAAWVVPGLFFVGLYRLLSALRLDPSRQSPPTIHVSGSDAERRKKAALAIRAWGWRTQVEPTLREPGTVGVALVEAEQSEAAEFDPQWPLKVSEADMAAGEVRQRLDRRDEIQVRRQFFRGLSKLFKRASTFKGPGGGGYWLAPHWWFFDSMYREDAEGHEEDIAPLLVGPPYHRVLPARARQQMYRVLRATHVDMIFIEDGVSYRKVEKILRVLLELYDVHGGQRRAEELHFRGLPKVRVMIHDYEPGNPFQSELYPEPKFDDLSRVRVLHVFRDRGGEEAETETPYDFSWSPAPVGVLN